MAVGLCALPSGAGPGEGFAEPGIVPRLGTREGLRESLPTLPKFLLQRLKLGCFRARVLLVRSFERSAQSKGKNSRLFFFLRFPWKPRPVPPHTRTGCPPPVPFEVFALMAYGSGMPGVGVEREPDRCFGLTR